MNIEYDKDVLAEVDSSNLTDYAKKYIELSLERLRLREKENVLLEEYVKLLKRRENYLCFSMGCIMGLLIIGIVLILLSYR